MADLKTQGTELFVLNTLETTPKLVKLNCINSISGLGSGAKSQVKTTRLSEREENQYMPGLGEPGSISVPFIFNPNEQDHKVLNQLKASGKVASWLIALSDGTAAPTVTGSTMTPPADRTAVAFNGYVSELTIDLAENEAVRGTLTIQRSGVETYTYKA